MSPITLQVDLCKQHHEFLMLHLSAPPVIIFYNKKFHYVRPVEGQNINFQTVFANFLIFFQTLEKFSEQNSSNFFHFYYTQRATIYTSEFVFATSQSEFKNLWKEPPV